MTIKQISILQEFKCAAGACPFNCCRGWRVPVDDSTYMKYLNQRGILGTLLRCAIEKKDDMVSFKGSIRGCPFWGFDRLCHLQKRYGESFMPLVCIQFPRQLYNLDFFAEETLYLACPEAARLFLLHAGDDMPLGFVETTGTPEYDVNTTNDDGEFLRYLVQSRGELIDLLESGCRYNDNALTDYALAAQNCVLSKKGLPSPYEFYSKESPISHIIEFTCADMDRLMFNGFYHPNLKKLSPFMYKLCRKYIRTLGRLSKFSPKKADEKLSRLISELYGKTDNLQRLLQRYYEYFLLSDFLDIFEDYSFNKHVSFGIDKANMLLTLLAVYASGKPHLCDDEIALVIATFERRAPQLY